MQQTKRPEFRASFLDQLLAPFMFGVTLFFLFLVATVLVLWVDVPRVAEKTSTDASAANAATSTATPDQLADEDQLLSAEELAFELSAFNAGRNCLAILLLLYPVFWAEQFLNFVRLPREESFRQHYPTWWLICLCPPLRLCTPRRGDPDEIWLPSLGWREVNRALQKKLERNFSIPMIWIALLILPVLGLQFVFRENIVHHPVLRIALHFSTGLIWFAFTLEFIVMVSVSDSKLRYCKKHWLDLAIILLPLISFLRSLRVLRTLRLLQVSQLSQFSKFVRVYRLRGVAMRAFRAFLVLEVIHRLLRTRPEKRIARLEAQREEKLRELQEIDEQIASLKLMSLDQGQQVNDDAGTS